MNGTFSYSRDSEIFMGDFATQEEAIAEVVRECDDGDFFWVGKNRAPCPEQFVDADTIIDAIINTDDFAMECAEHWPDCTKEQKADLTELVQKLVAEWVRKHHLEPDFYVVEEARRFVVAGGLAVERKEESIEIMSKTYHPDPEIADERAQRLNTSMNNGFWDRPADERAQAMQSACERFGKVNFFDLSPEERGAAYES